MTLIEIIEAMEFNEEDMRFYLPLVYPEAFMNGKTATLILVAAARHILDWQRDLPTPLGSQALDQFGDLVRRLAPQYPPRQQEFYVVGGTEFHPTPNGADNAQ